MPKTIQGPVWLEAGEDLSIAKNEIYLGLGELQRAINGPGGHTVRVAGTVTSEIQTMALGLIDSVLDNDVRIARTGLIESLSVQNGDYALNMEGNSNTLINHGTIESAGAVALRIVSTGDGVTTIANSGTISGLEGVVVKANNTVEFTNTGRVRAADGWESYRSAPLDPDLGGADHVTNKGRMIGLVTLGNGDDIYDGRLGTVHGRVSGREGDDLLAGGKERNLLYGEQGEDRLIGGRGGDTLAGGLDADVFVFATARESTVKASGCDLILDFSQSEADNISLRGIDANADKRGNQAFRFIDDDSFHAKAGELRYEIIEGKTIISGDTDGDRKANFSIALDGEISLTSDDFVL